MIRLTRCLTLAKVRADAKKYSLQCSETGSKSGNAQRIALPTPKLLKPSAFEMGALYALQGSNWHHHHGPCLSKLFLATVFALKVFPLIFFVFFDWIKSLSRSDGPSLLQNAGVLGLQTQLHLLGKCLIELVKACGFSGRFLDISFPSCRSRVRDSSPAIFKFDDRSGTTVVPLFIDIEVNTGKPLFSVKRCFVNLSFKRSIG
jgi:hypothetical protein